MLRVKESEVQYLKQEINSLKDELQAAQRVSFSFFFFPPHKFIKDLKINPFSELPNNVLSG